MKQRFAPKTSYETVPVYGDAARNALVEKITIIAKAVGTTMGPMGAPAMLDRDGRPPVITKDGVTVLYDLDGYDTVNFEQDHMYNIAYELLRASAEKVSKRVGDGTTSVCWLTAALCSQINRLLTADFDHRKVSAGVKDAIYTIMEEASKHTVIANDERTLTAALYTSANGEETIIDTLVEVFLEVGDEGMIFIRDPIGINTKVIYEEGTDIPCKLDTPEILEDTSMQLHMQDAYVLVLADRIYSSWQLVDILDEIATKGETKNLIIAYTEMSDDAKLFLNKNNRDKENGLTIASFRMPLYTQRQRGYLDDIAAMSDATTIDIMSNVVLKNAGIAQLGRVKDVFLTGSLTRFVGGRGSEVTLPDGRTKLQARIDELTAERDEFTGNLEERNRLNERLAKLNGVVVSVCPGARSESEVARQKGAYEDAIRAGESALKEGILPGSGWLWYYIARNIKPANTDYQYKAGFEAGCKAMMSIFEKLCLDINTTANLTYKKILDFCEENNCDPETTVYNMRTGEIGNFVDVKVVDPVLLQDYIVEQSMSTAITLMSTDCVILNEPTEEFKEFKRIQKFENLKV